MKKLVAIILMLIMAMAFSIPTMAHPNVPEQSLNNISENSVNGMHTAAGKVQNSKGAASHVFMYRFNPHD